MWRTMFKTCFVYYFHLVNTVYRWRHFRSVKQQLWQCNFKILVWIVYRGKGQSYHPWKMTLIFPMSRAGVVDLRLWLAINLCTESLEFLRMNCELSSCCLPCNKIYPFAHWHYAFISTYAPSGLQKFISKGLTRLNRLFIPTLPAHATWTTFLRNS